METHVTKSLINENFRELFKLLYLDDVYEDKNKKG